MSASTKTVAKAAGLGLLVIAAFAGLYSWSDLWLGTYLHNFVQGQAQWFVPLLVVGSGIGALFQATAIRDRNYSRRAESRWNYYGTPEKVEQPAKASRGLGNATVVTSAGVVTILIGAVALFYVFFHSGYAADQKYLGAVHESKAAQPQLKERAAWDVANAQAPGAQGTFRGKIDRTAYVADKGVYGSLIKKSGSGSSSYVGVMEQTLAFTGQSTVKVCKFSPRADKRLGGYFGHSMERALSHLERGLIVEDSDAYGYCDGDTPMVVIPVKKLKGWFPAIQVPAGVAVYNGKTGELKLNHDMAADQLPGPVYPMSLAARQREALAAYQGSWWQSLRGQVGYSDTSSDDHDPNGTNRSELALATTDGQDVYATPLTMRGRNGAIAALGMSTAGSVHAGHLNTYTLYDLKEPRKANSAVADRIKTDYADLPDWAAGMTIFEISPVSNGTWVASLGQKQNVAYRVRVNADGSSCLETADGTKIRCGARSGGTFNTTTPGTQTGIPGSTTPVELPANAAELAKMTDAQVAQLQKQLTDELVRRINAKQQSK